VVLACAVTGCNAKPTVIASGEEHIDGLAADGSGVYWTNGVAGTVRFCGDVAKGCAGGSPAPVTLADGASNPGPVGTDQAYVYYAAKGATAGTGALLRVAK
jgi:hypothetical protein